MRFARTGGEISGKESSSEIPRLFVAIYQATRGKIIATILTIVFMVRTMSP